MSVKKFYWLKLKEDFFRQKEIKKLRKIAGGDTYTIIYLKMQLLSLKNEGVLYYEGTEESFEEQLSLEIDEDIENIKVTLAFLFNNNLIEEMNENEFLLIKANDCMGKESESAARVRKHRERKDTVKVEEPKINAIHSMTNAQRQRKYRAKKNCEQKQHVPYIEDYLNNKRYGGNYYLVMQRDKYRCSICGSIENLCIHHIDGYSEDKPENNNENKMLTLCRHCHSIVHSGTKINDDILDSIQYYSNVTLHGNANVTKGNKNVTTEIEIEKDIEKEIEKRDRDKIIESQSSIDFSKEEVFKHFERCGFLINPRLIDFIAADIEVYSAQWLMDAADLAMERGKINYKYVKGILMNWKSEGRKENKNGKGNPKSSEDLGQKLRDEGIGFTVDDL